ncbi:MAG: hypothetical protein RL748_4231 [Pseudomonadota bacterium]|jgi:hypothetical protein
MKQLSALALACLISSAATAADVKFATKDNSPETLMTPAAAAALWQEALPAKVAKIYPVKKWGYISEVNGGFDANKTCVIVARAMMVPLTGKTFVYDPKKTSVAFGSQVGATAEQCTTLARTKLKEAVQSVASSLVAN